MRVCRVLSQRRRMLFRQLQSQQLAGAFFVGVLAAPAFHAHRNARCQMRGAHGAVGFIDMLPAFAARAAGFKTDAVVIGQRGNLRQPENADIPVFTRMLRAHGAVANPLQRAEPALRQGFCARAVEGKRGGQNAVFAAGLAQQLGCHTGGFGFAQDLAQRESGENLAFGGRLPCGELQINHSVPCVFAFSGCLNAEKGDLKSVRHQSAQPPAVL